jgi:hypothetical protein
MGVRLKRLGLVAAMAVVTLNIWTGAPLLGLWIGSRVAPDSGISMTAVFVVILVIGAAAFLLVRLLGWLQVRHDALTGHETRRRQTTWLRAMSGERPHAAGGEAPPLTAADYTIVSVVVLAVAAFEVWFFFFAGSSLGGA